MTVTVTWTAGPRVRAALGMMPGHYDGPARSLKFNPWPCKPGREHHRRRDSGPTVASGGDSLASLSGAA